MDIILLDKLTRTIALMIVDAKNLEDIEMVAHELYHRYDINHLSENQFEYLLDKLNLKAMLFKEGKLKEVNND